MQPNALVSPFLRSSVQSMDGTAFPPFRQLFVNVAPPHPPHPPLRKGPRSSKPGSACKRAGGFDPRSPPQQGPFGFRAAGIRVALDPSPKDRWGWTSRCLPRFHSGGHSKPIRGEQSLVPLKRPREPSGPLLQGGPYSHNEAVDIGAAVSVRDPRQVELPRMRAPVPMVMFPKIGTMGKTSSSGRRAGPPHQDPPGRPEALPRGARGAGRHEPLGDLPDRERPPQDHARHPPAHRPGPRGGPHPDLGERRLAAGQEERQAREAVVAGLKPSG